ncbi:MAG: hypothetical protein Q8840_02350, partial [Sweet potato little leaf phytoplasma]|nr:hypothetical protein [Sweet potato little leaf phytoplasma]
MNDDKFIFLKRILMMFLFCFFITMILRFLFLDDENVNIQSNISDLKIIMKNNRDISDNQVFDKLQKIEKCDLYEYQKYLDIVVCEIQDN